jgi:acetate kinase
MSSLRLLIFNAGSSSLKCDLVETTGVEASVLLSASYADAADGSGQFVFQTNHVRPGAAARVGSLAEAAAALLRWLADASVHHEDVLASVVATVHRVVHGGECFRQTTRLGETDLQTLDSLSTLAPLHNPPALAVMRVVREVVGHDRPLIGVFDTAYYAHLPEAAYRYAVPAYWATELGVRRYGFHGMAHQYLCSGARTRLHNRPHERIISLQLGRGCSVTATYQGRAIATSMGFTPLEGLVMGTRSGDIDPGAMLYVMERTGMSPQQMREELNSRSGLLGLSGHNADVRELLAQEKQGHAGATLALEVFCRRIRHYLSAYMTELRGVDVIVFGGGIGENSPDIRQRILANFQWMGIHLDAIANAACRGVAASIATPASSAAIEVIPVSEATVMASEAAANLGV